jgi:hypothetical protein
MAACLCLMGCQQAAGPWVGASADWQCAQWCVLRIAPFVGLTLTREAVGRHLSGGDQGHTLDEVRLALKALGIPTRGRQLPWSDFAGTATLPAIVHLRHPDHYVIAVKSTTGEILWIDGTETGGYLTAAHVEIRWSGYLLEVPGSAAAEMNDAASTLVTTGPAGRFDALQQDAGAIDPRQPSIEYAYRLWNVGREPLSILKLEGDCACLEAVAPTGEIAPGASAVVKLHYAVEKDTPAGRILRTALVKTNDPSRHEWTLVASGYMNQAVMVRPALVDFGRVHPETTAVRSITVTAHALASEFEIIRIRTESPELEAELMDFDASPSWQGALTPIPAARNARSGARRIELRLRPTLSGCRKVDFATKLECETNHPQWANGDHSRQGTGRAGGAC